VSGFKLTEVYEQFLEIKNLMVKETVLMKNIMIAVFAIGLLILVGCGNPVSAQPTNTPPPTNTLPSPTNTPPPTNTLPPPTNTSVPEVMVVGDPEKGQQFFESGGANELTTEAGVFCAYCHTYDGSDEKTHIAPDLKGISERAGETVSGLSAAQYIHQSIMDPKAYVVDGYSYMSAHPSRQYTENEIADIVAFLLTQ
jgi:cytochrome c553